MNAHPHSTETFNAALDGVNIKDLAIGYLDESRALFRAIAHFAEREPKIARALAEVGRRLADDSQEVVTAEAVDIEAIVKQVAMH